ncbi:hypothetical protein GHT06_011551 [Daphnia sinensis]|uniref:Cc8L18.2-like protein n=1 Tax=Daphnia sinensis TaxID=1820382 RepID=A0AAD5KWT9_9CRUS|nr:hypothetical protein GHT06_011551 [Daphnia sinensis]
MDISLDKWYVGVIVNSDCFKYRVIKVRVSSDSVKTICAHHFSMYYEYYGTLHLAKNSCDPFNIHKRVIRGVKKIDLELSDRVFSADKNLRLIPGKILCPRCSTKITVLSREPQTPRHNVVEAIENDNEISSPFVLEKIIAPRRVIDALCSAAVITPIIDLDQSNAERRSRICASALENLKRSILSSENDSLLKLKSSDYSELMKAVKQKIKSTEKRGQKLSLLTLAPASWTHRQTTCPAAKTASRRMSNDEKQRSIDFYTSDEYSRQLPGMKSVKQPNGKRLKVQKRLLLVNEYKNIDGIKTFGLSAFADLRPKHVITNVKLMLSAIGLGEERHLLMDKVVCSVYNKTCMMTRCPSCPKSEALESFLEDLIGDENETISYKQWTHTDDNKLENILCDSDDFIERVVSVVQKLTTHHLIARNQSAFFVQSKEKTDRESCVLVSDFSENYSFIIQNSVQGYYWANHQATILPFMAYMKRHDGSVFNVSIAIISDHLTHDTISVHAYLNPVLTHLKTINPLLKSIKYFTDGSGAQYKNKKNSRICWHFFATCHGKSACDGIGGTVKRLARLASLLRGVNDQITTSKQLFDWTTENLEIKCIYVTSTEVKANEALIIERMQNAIAVNGTRKFHCFVPINLFQVKASVLSGDGADFTTFNILPNSTSEVFDFFSCTVNDYIACINPDDMYWYVTQIISLEAKSGLIRGYKPTKTKKKYTLVKLIVKNKNSETNNFKK